MRFFASTTALMLCVTLGVTQARADDTSRPGSARTYAKGDVFRPITEDADFKYANYAIQVVNARTGDEVWSWDADELLAPASVTKVVTTAAGFFSSRSARMAALSFPSVGKVASNTGVLSNTWKKAFQVTGTRWMEML